MIRQRASPRGARSSKKIAWKFHQLCTVPRLSVSIHSLFERQSILLWKLFISGSKIEIFDAVGAVSYPGVGLFNSDTICDVN